MLRPLFKNIPSSSTSALLLTHKTCFLFANRKKGLTKEERSIHGTYEYFEKMEAKETFERNKKLKRKGLDPDTEPRQSFITDEMFNRYLNNPELLSVDNVVFDEETGIMAKKEVIADLNNLVKTKEYEEFESFIKKDTLGEKDKPQLSPEEIDERRQAKRERKLALAQEKKLLEESQSHKDEESFEELDDGNTVGRGRRVKKLSFEVPEEVVDPKKEQNFESALKQFSQKTEIPPPPQRNNQRFIEQQQEEEHVPKQKSDKFERSERPERNERSERSERNERFERSERPERQERQERPERPERQERIKNNERKSRYEERLEEEEEFSLKPRNSRRDEDSHFENILNEFATSTLRDTTNQGRSQWSDQDEDLLEEDQPRKNRPQIQKRQEEEQQVNSIGLDKGKLDSFYQEISPEKIEKIERIQQTREKKPLDSDARKVASNVYSHRKDKNQPMIKEYDTFVKSLEKKKSLEKFYFFLRKVEPDNLVKLLSQNSLIENDPVENIPKFLILLNFIRKNRILQNYNREDIYHVVESILKNIQELRYTELSALAVLLERMRIDKVEYFREIEKRVIEDASNMSIRTISNIIFSFGRISTKQSIIEDFSELFGKMENVIALKVNNMKPKDLCQIMVGYSKSQNFSPEFLYVLEQACIANFKMMNSQEMAIISHSFAKNDYASAEFFKLLKEAFLTQPEKFKIMEVALVAEALERVKMLDEKVMKQLEKQFLVKNEHANAQDVAILFKILTRPEYKMSEKTYQQMKQICDFLFKNFDSNCLRRMCDNFAEKYEKGTIKWDITEILIRKFKSLRKKNEIKGSNLHEIKNEFFKVKDENVVRRAKQAFYADK